MTMTPEELATNADFLILNLAAEVKTAEEQIANQMASASRVLDQAIQRAASGRSLNSLGELQSTGMAVDCKVGHLEQAATAFETTWRYLGQGFPFAGNPDETRSSLQEWFDGIVEKSPRVKAIVDQSKVGQR